ncbi:MAG: VPLPA-CTERM sorting domain-containing protein [Rhodobacteraceae bacterium]|nr:VPLPA-CTERM sorting domain-containing protein [Paracoccaceae bacterium]
MFLKKLAGAGALAVAALAGTSASAAVVTVFDGVAAGRTAFDNTVAATGATVQSVTLSGLSDALSINAGAFTITSNDGGFVNLQGYGTLSGQVVSIDPDLNLGASEPPDGRASPLSYFNSGLTFTFASGVNAFGFEVGDWGTCCTNPTTDLFISFDGGAPILVGSANPASTTFFPSQDGSGNLAYEIFVSAIDDTATFTTVSFWGNGLGEFLVAGGNIRYATVGVGTLPGGNDPPVVPLPAAGWLLLAGLGGLAAMKKRRAA